ncbi:MAG: HAD family phosphatase [Pseudomonadota bacterium]
MKAIVFDVGNVLIRWDARLVYRDDFATEAEIDTFLQKIGFDAWNLEQDRGRSWADGVAEAVARHPGHRALIEKFHTHWHDAVPDAIAGSLEILERLYADGQPLYAITNFSAEKWVECQKRFPFLTNRFRDVVVSAHERLVKPDLAIFHLFLRRNGLPAQDCIFIDDSAKNVAAAQSVGMDAVIFTGPGALDQALRQRGLPL